MDRCKEIEYVEARRRKIAGIMDDLHRKVVLLAVEDDRLYREWMRLMHGIVNLPSDRAERKILEELLHD